MRSVSGTCVLQGLIRMLGQRAAEGPREASTWREPQSCPPLDTFPCNSGLLHQFPVTRPTLHAEFPPFLSDEAVI